MMNKEKIGLFITTCNRLEYFKKCYNSIDKSKIDYLVVCNDGEKYDLITDCDLIQHHTNQKIPITKNDCIQYLLNRNCSWIFGMEDDIIILNNDIFQKYIELSKTTNLKYFSWCSHAWDSGLPYNRTPMYSIDYPNNIKLSIYKHMVNCFVMYHKDVFNKVGMIDTNYENSVFDVDFTYRISKAELTTPMFAFVDLDSTIIDDYLYMIPDSQENSVAHGKGDEWNKSIEKGFNYFKQIHKVSINEIIPPTLEEVKNFLKKKYKERINI